MCPADRIAAGARRPCPAVTPGTTSPPATREEGLAISIWPGCIIMLGCTGLRCLLAERGAMANWPEQEQPDDVREMRPSGCLIILAVMLLAALIAVAVHGLRGGLS